MTQTTIQTLRTNLLSALQAEGGIIATINVADARRGWPQDAASKPAGWGSVGISVLTAATQAEHMNSRCGCRSTEYFVLAFGGRADAPAARLYTMSRGSRVVDLGTVEPHTIVDVINAALFAA